MREIKFRCWNKTGEWNDEKDELSWQMIDAESLSFEEFEPLIDLLTSDENSEIFMQYTGLKDKNDKEIYEGDIVRDSRSNDIYIIEWGKYGFIQKEYDEPDTLLEYPEYCEVIGNIYENPELLK